MEMVRSGNAILTYWNHLYFSTQQCDVGKLFNPISVSCVQCVQVYSSAHVYSGVFKNIHACIITLLCTICAY